MKGDHKYDYSDAGYNGFYRRSLGSNAQVATLTELPMLGSSNNLNFDNAQTSGRLGDSIQVGNVVIDGKKGRIDIKDDQGNVVGRFGNISND